MGILASIGTFLVQTVLKVFLTGLFNTVLQKLQDDAQHAVDTAHLQIDTTNAAAAVAVQMAQDDAKVRIQYETAKPDSSDPFGAAAWNAGK